MGIVCPSCRTMLRLPAPGETPPSLIVEAAHADEDEDSHDHDHDHDPDHDHDHDAEESSPFPWKLILGMAVPGIALLVAFGMWLKAHSRPAPPPLVAIPPLRAKEPPSPDAELAKSIPNGGKLLADLEPLVKNFMEAPTMDAALKYVAEPERTKARWLAWLDGKPYEAPGFRGVQSDLAIAENGLVSFAVSTADYEERSVAFHTLGAEPKVDWESWVGWSEMSWKEFRKQRPTEPKWFRVILTQVDYYNFGFIDESKWACYQLISPDGLNSVYGYLPRASALDNEIRPDRPKERVSLIVQLKFPEKAPSDNQVLIEKITGQGWIETKASR